MPTNTTTTVKSIRYESDDVIWLRNHAFKWILVPNIGCKQTMASNIGGPLTFFFFFFFVCSHIFLFRITPRQYEEEKFRSITWFDLNEISPLRITPRQYEEEKFRSNQTTLLKEILRLPIAE